MPSIKTILLWSIIQPVLFIMAVFGFYIMVLIGFEWAWADDGEGTPIDPDYNIAQDRFPR